MSAVVTGATSHAQRQKVPHNVSHNIEWRSIMAEVCQAPQALQSSVASCVIKPMRTDGRARGELVSLELHDDLVDAPLGLLL